MLKSTSVPKQSVTFPDSVITLIELKRNGNKGNNMTTTAITKRQTAKETIQ